MEELESLDQKALETAYVNSYNYTTSQRVVAVIAVIVVILAIIGLGTYLFLNVINILKP
jgi:hypothetical protein